MFGETIRTRRLELGLSLRAFCAKHGEDPSNWSKMERGVSEPPEDYARLYEIAKALEIPEGREQTAFFDLAAAERGRLPKDLMEDKDLISTLPIVFRSIREGGPSKEDLLHLADLIKKAKSR